MTTPTAPRFPPTQPGGEPFRLFNQSRRTQLEVIGLKRSRVTDGYHLLLRAPWWGVLLTIVGTFLLANAFFALLYRASHGIGGAHDGSFLDAFFFSVQTMGTIGYGVMYPQTVFANVLVTLESIGGLIGLAMVTGLVFAKFARPTARVLFSQVAVITVRDGVPTLMFRMANERRNHVVEATLRVAALRNTVTKEGERFRKIDDLVLARQTSPAFIMTWTALHPITPGSPLYGMTAESLAGSDLEILVTLMGLDETLAQTIHARHSYVAREIIFGAKLSDVLKTLPNGRRVVDLAAFHDHEPATAPTWE
jgi:inward rectifier potassium channel